MVGAGGGFALASSLVVMCCQLTKRSPVATWRQCRFLFCTSMDAVCAVCTGHHSNVGNSASRDRGKQNNKQTTPHKQKHQPNRDPPSHHFQSFDLYRRVKQSETWIDCNYLLGPRILQNHLLFMLVERLCVFRLGSDQPAHRR